MPKRKTKSSIKGRFSLTGTGKVRANQANKRHGMTKKSKRQLRNQRGTTVLAAADAKNVIRFFLPYGRD
jgi:large subunit ribosomal protein L35